MGNLLSENEDMKHDLDRYGEPKVIHVLCHAKDYDNMMKKFNRYHPHTLRDKTIKVKRRNQVVELMITGQLYNELMYWNGIENYSPHKIESIHHSRMVFYGESSLSTGWNLYDEKMSLAEHMRDQIIKHRRLKSLVNKYFNNDQSPEFVSLMVKLRMTDQPFVYDPEDPLWTALT